MHSGTGSRRLPVGDPVLAHRRRACEFASRGVRNRRDLDDIVAPFGDGIRWTAAAGFPYEGTYVGPQVIAENVFGRGTTDLRGIELKSRPVVTQPGRSPLRQNDPGQYGYERGDDHFPQGEKCRIALVNVRVALTRPRAWSYGRDLKAR